MAKGSRSFKRSDVIAMARDQNNRCACCRSDLSDLVMVGDHIMPWSKGGPTEPWNLLVLCSDCNYEKSNKCPMQWAIYKNVILDKKFFDGMYSFIKGKHSHEREKAVDALADSPKFDKSIPAPTDDEYDYVFPKPTKLRAEVKNMKSGDSLLIAGTIVGGVVHASIMQYQSKTHKRFKVRSAKGMSIRVWRVS